MFRIFRKMHPFEILNRCIQQNPQPMGAHSSQVESAIGEQSTGSVEPVGDTTPSEIDLAGITFDFGADSDYSLGGLVHIGDDYRAMLHQPGIQRFVVRYEGKIIGRVVWRVRYKALQLHQFHLEPGYPTNPIARSVFRELIKRSECFQPTCVWVLVSKWYDDAQLFFEAFGFSVTLDVPQKMTKEMSIRFEDLKQRTSLSDANESVPAVERSSPVTIDTADITFDRGTIGDLTPLGTRLSDQYYWQMATHPSTDRFVMRVGETVIGYVLWKISGNRIRLLQFHVNEEYEECHTIYELAYLHLVGATRDKTSPCFWDGPRSISVNFQDGDRKTYSIFDKLGFHEEYRSDDFRTMEIEIA